jgi:predicted AlkP superfamily pyrophosphatase or phosphodiesterase
MAATCKRAFVIGLDGLRGPAVAEANTPNLDAFCAEAAWSDRARSVMPSSSYPAWGSMLHGVSPDKHRLGGETPIDEDADWPSFIKIARQAHPEWTIGAFSCWNPINRDLIEESCNCVLRTGGDDTLAPAAGDFIRHQKPDLFFLHLDYIDGAGHGRGYRSPEYYKQIELTDQWVGLVLQAIRDIDAYDDSLIVIASDHGGCEIEHEGKVYHSHGTDDADCMEIFWSVRGPGIAAGTHLDGEVCITDTAPTVAAALGLTIPDGWDARTPPAGLLG